MNLKAVLFRGHFIDRKEAIFDVNIQCGTVRQLSVGLKFVNVQSRHLAMVAILPAL